MASQNDGDCLEKGLLVPEEGIELKSKADLDNAAYRARMLAISFGMMLLVRIAD
jgi:hypothetical protein